VPVQIIGWASHFCIKCFKFSYIIDISTLSDEWLAKNFLDSICCRFALLIVPFAVQKFFNLTKSYMSNLLWFPELLESYSRNYWIFCFGGTGVWTQSLLAKQVCYHMRYTYSFQCFSVWIESQSFWKGLASECDSPSPSTKLGL
jgi:hypothetical protein